MGNNRMVISLPRLIIVAKYWIKSAIFGPVGVKESRGTDFPPINELSAIEG